VQFYDRILAWLGLASVAPSPTGAAHARCRSLAETALALAAGGAGSIEEILSATVHGGARMTGGAVILALVDARGRLERFAAEGADGCMRETLARPGIIEPLVDRLRALGRPVGPDDLDPATARTLAGLAPGGFVAVPVGPEVTGVLVLAEPRAGDGLEDELVAGATVVAALAAEALAGVERVRALRESREELRHLASEILAGRDREQRDLAHALHEGTCQRLAAVNAELLAFERVLAGDPDTAREPLRHARVLVKQTLGELRELAQELRPSILEDFGYVQALRWYVGRLRERGGVAPALEIEEGEERLPLEVEGALFRATEDALLGMRPGEAPGRLTVSVRGDSAALRLELPNGRADPLRLVTMQERLRPFGGAVRVSSAPGVAIVIEARVSTTVN
jgi:signal transduction histidine kinase